MHYPIISKNDIKAVLNESILRKKINEYIIIMNEYHRNGITDDFKKRFCSFYGLNKRVLSKRKDIDFEQFKNDYFSFIKKDVSGDLDFRTIFEKVKKLTNRNDISFSSKLLHTINPNMPIWDSELRKQYNFNISNVYYKANTEECIEKYNEYKTLFNSYKKDNDGGKVIIDMFDDVFKNNKDIKSISNTKKIDFVLWLWNRIE